MLKTYEEAVSYIHSRPRLRKETTQKRILNLLAKLGNPQHEVKSVHVVGTNGKGSVVAYLLNMLQGIGKRVGTFTSPFMIRFNERISINGQPIPDADLLAIVNQVKPIVDEIDDTNAEMGPSEFEVLTALMYLYFAQQKLDLAIVEAGIGGETDSTNVDDNSIMTIITTIGMDHMKLLGNTITKIAHTKAGIIKPNTPTIVGKLPSKALAEVETVAATKSSPLTIMGKDYTVKIDNQHHFDFSSLRMDIFRIKTNMLGKFEMEDAGIAIAAFTKLNKLEFKLKDKEVKAVIKAEIQQTKWIGRMEVINSNPLTIIDGAHNVPAIKSLKESLSDYANRQIDLVMAVFADKQYQQMLDILESMPNVNLYLTSFVPDENRKVADFSFVDESKVKYAANWMELISELELQNYNDKQKLIVITGSLLFISEVRKYLLEN
ncbi:bifunctional folylpolyglutamate synthase/dihydrofolate synthase [Fructilactobacillus sp. Tb1]|uniref:bifunctional folylpolyglutamate synthase/dihydrofolate synthase n=1 Tax=Fructilactobacillus sp. Tb1 TaxID=3422304 RepID=UPI003D273A98